MVLVFESFSQHIDSDIAYHERAQRAIHPTTSPSILTFGLFLRPPHSPFFTLSVLCVREISFYPSNGIMVLVFELFSQHIDIAYYERAQRAIHL